MKVILLLAGKGTRFLPVTSTTPKPLVPVAGAPVVAHILDALGDLEITDLIIVAGYLKEDIDTYFKQNYDGPFRIITQKTLDGTGGAVFAAREEITEPVLIIFGDTVFDADLSMLKGKCTANLIWAARVDDPENYGIVQTDEMGRMARIVEKSKEDVGRNANIGMYYIADFEALRAGLDAVMARPPIKGEYYFTYALNHMVEQGFPIDVHTVRGWYDCGNLDALISTNKHLLAQQNLPTTHPNAKIIPPVSIGRNVELQGCTLGPNVSIGDNVRLNDCIMHDSIVGESVELDGVQVAHSVIGPHSHLKNETLNRSIVAHGEIRKIT